MVEYCLSWMSEAEVAEMASKNDLLEDHEE
jgi:hypothetical protein